MDIATVLGLIIGIGGIILGNIIEGGHVASLIQGAAFVIVISGTAGAVLVSTNIKDFKKALSMGKIAFRKSKRDDLDKLLVEIVECAKIARKDTILSIEARIENMPKPYMRSVVRAVVDGVDPQVIRAMFEKEIENSEDKQLQIAKLWTEAGGYSPTIGIIGAVLGLIHVMGNLSDTSQLGVGIAVAFVATIYGVGFANLIFLPIGSKLKKLVIAESKVKEMILESYLSIQAGHSPSMVELRARSYVNSLEAQ